MASNRTPLPDSLSASVVIEALEWIDAGKPHNFSPSTDYDLVHEGKSYPPKAVAGVAAQLVNGKTYYPRDFSAGVDSKCFRILEKAGFRILPKTPPSNDQEMNFQPGKTYNRQNDINEVFGGQQRGGISTPKGTPFVFLFTGQSGEAFGYEDKFQPDGSFWYTGEGQVGDMTLTRGNLAIAEHERNGKRLLLFEVVKKGTIRFAGEARLVQYHTEQRPDRDGNLRSALVFELEILPEGPAPAADGDTTVPEAKGTKLWSMSKKDLRKLASRPAPRGSSRKQQKRIVHQRSEAVRVYVLKRADGICELCENPAPFKNRKNRPYLEPHHMTRLADGGPDHPAHVAACCPNCHREIHFGKEGDELNRKLQDKIALIEPSDS